MTTHIKPILKAKKLGKVSYEIRGSLLRTAQKLESEGHIITKLNTGDPSAFDLFPPEEIVQDLILNLPQAYGYCDSGGVFSARKAIMQYCQKQSFPPVSLADILVGNGVSELVIMSMQALLNQDDEMLIPAPDYPLWTAVVNLCGGKAVHYLKDEKSDWNPDIADLKRKITDKTKGIVIINPNNPTGAVYSKDILEEIVNIAEQHQLILFADEIYDKILYDGAQHVAVASIAKKRVPCISYNGLSKSYRSSGFRTGWLIASGPDFVMDDYFSGINTLASMRLCANVPPQFCIQTALGGYQSIQKLTLPKGRLYEQVHFAWEQLSQIPGVSCVKPKGSVYLFPKLDLNYYNIQNDEIFALNFLKQKKVLIVHGTGFHWPKPDHIRLVAMARVEELASVIHKLEEFLHTLKK